jgi:hypothetical protein
MLPSRRAGCALALALANRSRERYWQEGVPGVRLLTDQGRTIAVTRRRPVGAGGSARAPAGGAVFPVTVGTGPPSGRPPGVRGTEAEPAGAPPPEGGGLGLPRSGASAIGAAGVRGPGQGARMGP